MRVLCWIVVVTALAGCRTIYSSELADMTVWPDDLPAAGTSSEVLKRWFVAEGYAPGPDVHQSVASLMRRPGDPLPYTHAKEKLWWHTQSRSVRDFCITTRTIFYRMGDNGSLDQAIQSHRSSC